MRDYGGFSLQSPKLYVRTLTDGEIHGGLRPQWSFIIQQMRGPRKIAERFRIQDSVLCETSGHYVVCKGSTLKTHNLQERKHESITLYGKGKMTLHINRSYK